MIHQVYIVVWATLVLVMFSGDIWLCRQSTLRLHAVLSLFTGVASLCYDRCYQQQCWGWWTYGCRLDILSPSAWSPCCTVWNRVSGIRCRPCGLIHFYPCLQLITNQSALLSGFDETFTGVCAAAAACRYWADRWPNDGWWLLFMRHLGVLVGNLQPGSLFLPVYILCFHRRQSVMLCGRVAVFGYSISTTVL